MSCYSRSPQCPLWTNHPYKDKQAHRYAFGAHGSEGSATVKRRHCQSAVATAPTPEATGSGRFRANLNVLARSTARARPGPICRTPDLTRLIGTLLKGPAGWPTYLFKHEDRGLECIFELRLWREAVAELKKGSFHWPHFNSSS